jgi:hypothetical protein
MQVLNEICGSITSRYLYKIFFLFTNFYFFFDEIFFKYKKKTFSQNKLNKYSIEKKKIIIKNKFVFHKKFLTQLLIHR